MRTETYCLPVFITVTDEKPNRIAKKIAEGIYDGIQDVLESAGTDCERVEVEYKIFIRGKEKDFEEERQ